VEGGALVVEGASMYGRYGYRGGGYSCRKERLLTQGTKMRRTIVLSMMNERKTIEQYLPRTGRGLGMLWTSPVEQVDERIKVQTPSRIDIEIE
jgi:hypothetical protein